MEIILRPISIDDGKMIVKWRNSPKVLAHCLNHQKITIESNEDFFKENIETGKYMQFIVERIEEQMHAASYPIATIYFKDIDKYNNRCELCVFTSDDEEWNTESQRIAIKQMLKIAFDKLKMHKVYTNVFFKFTEELNLFREVGFELETILRKEALTIEGEYDDVLRLSIFNHDN